FLLGVIQVFEDRIPDPVPPKVVKEIDHLAVTMNSPPRLAYADLTAVFRDEDTPDSDMEYRIAKNTITGVVTATIDARRRLSLAFAPGRRGDGSVTVQATDPFGLTAETTFRVTVHAGDMTFSWFKAVEVPVAEHTVPAVGPGDRRMVDDRKMDLGTVLFDYVLRPGQLVAPCASGDLLPEGETLVMGARTAKSLFLRLRCRTSVATPGDKSPKDMLVGFKDRRRRLAVRTPQLICVYHVFLIKVHLNCPSGLSDDLYSNCFYKLVSPSTYHLRDLDSGVQHLPAALARSLVDTCLRSYGESRAYRMAELCGAVAPGFDATAASLYCYYGDPTSPFRDGGLPADLTQHNRWPRSTAIGFLATVKEKDVRIWSLLETQFGELAARESGALRQKAIVARDSVLPTDKTRRMVRSSVRVERP
ncbi:hypothetical protein ACFL09_05730, partial [Planctomycetota bacterium]